MALQVLALQCLQVERKKLLKTMGSDEGEHTHSLENSVVSLSTREKVCSLTWPTFLTASLYNTHTHTHTHT